MTVPCPLSTHFLLPHDPKMWILLRVIESVVLNMISVVTFTAVVPRDSRAASNSEEDDTSTIEAFAIPIALKINSSATFESGMRLRASEKAVKA